MSEGASWAQVASPRWIVFFFFSQQLTYIWVLTCYHFDVAYRKMWVFQKQTWIQQRIRSQTEHRKLDAEAASTDISVQTNMHKHSWRRFCTAAPAAASNSAHYRPISPHRTSAADITSSLPFHLTVRCIHYWQIHFLEAFVFLNFFPGYLISSFTVTAFLLFFPFNRHTFFLALFKANSFILSSDIKSSRAEKKVLQLHYAH